MTCSATLTINASGDWAATATATDETGSALDLTGYTASVVDVTGDLAGALTASIPDAQSVRLSLTWQGVWATSQARLGTARVALVNGTDETVSAPFRVEVSGPGIRLVVPRGADLAYRFTWPDDRDGADLTGETLDIINASATLAPLASVAVIDATMRECELRIEGDLSVAIGDAGTLQARRRISGAQPRTTQPFAVSFK